MATAELVKEESTFNLHGCPLVNASDGGFNPLRAILVYRGNTAIIEVKGTKVSGQGAWRSARFSMAPHSKYPLAPKWLIEAIRESQSEGVPVEPCGLVGSVTSDGRWVCPKPRGHILPHKFDLEE